MTNDYREEIEKLAKKQHAQVETEHYSPITAIIGDFKGDTCEQGFQIIEGKGTLMIKVYHMPKTPFEWEMFDKWMRLFNANPKKMRESGLLQEKTRAKSGRNPNELLFALEMVWKK